MELFTRMAVLLIVAGLCVVTQGADNDTAANAPPAEGNLTESDVTQSPASPGDGNGSVTVGVTEGDDGDKVVEPPEATEQVPPPAVGKDDEKEETPVDQGSPARVLRVAGIQAPAYLFDNPNATENTTGNDRYTGFIKEMLDAMTEEIGMEYEIYLADGYGKQENGKWSGAIGELAQGKADVAAGPLTVTLEREEAVDFTWPYQRFEAMIVLAKRHPDKEPKIESLDDLLNQDVVSYGVSENGAVHKFLKDSKEDLHKKMLDHINSEFGLLRENNNNGVWRARRDDQFAFLLEGSAANYVLSQPPCDLEGFPTGFYARQYALAVQQKNDLREDLNKALVKIQSSGVMADLTSKWLEKGMCAGAASLPLVSFITAVCCALAALLMSSTR